MHTPYRSMKLLHIWKHVCGHMPVHAYIFIHLFIYCLFIYLYACIYIYSSHRPSQLCVPRLGHVGGGWPTTSLGHRSDRWGGATVQPSDCLIWASFATSPFKPRSMRRTGLLRLQLANLERSNSLGSENSSNRASAFN